MAFKKKTWKDRLVEFPGRRLLKRIAGSADDQIVVDVERSEGTVSQGGDAFSAANMNDLEQRIADEFEEVNNDLAQQPQWIKDSNGKITGYKTQAGADTVFPFSNVRYINMNVASVSIDFDPDIIIICSGAHHVLRYKGNTISMYGEIFYFDTGRPSNGVDYTDRVFRASFVYHENYHIIVAKIND